MRRGRHLELEVTARRIAWTMSLASSLGLIVGFSLLIVASEAAPSLTDPLAAVFFVGSVATFAITGPLIASRQPRNPIGWIFCLASLLNGVQTLLGGYAGFGLSSAAPLPGAILSAWLFAWMGVFILVPVTIYPLLLFPNGVLPSRRWRPLAAAGAVGIAATALAFALVPGPLAIIGTIDNPFGVRQAAGLILDIGAVGVVLVVIAAGGAAASVFVRLTRAKAEERQQLKVLAVAASIILAAFGAILGLGLPAVAARIPAGLALAVLAGAMAAAILRYRLYDIDLLIRRTLVYGVLSAALVATYAASVVLLQAAVRPLTGGSDLAVAGSTLATLALVQPLRRRIQQGVDRRFYRSRYDAASTLDALSARLRDEVHLDAVRADVLDAVGRTLQPAHAGLWLTGTPRNDLRTPRE